MRAPRPEFQKFSDEPHDSGVSSEHCSRQSKRPKRSKAGSSNLTRDVAIIEAKFKQMIVLKLFLFFHKNLHNIAKRLIGFWHEKSMGADVPHFSYIRL